VAAVTLVDGDRPFRATIPDNLNVTENDTVVVGYTTSGSAYVENILTQTDPPDTGSGDVSHPLTTRLRVTGYTFHSVTVQSLEYPNGMVFGDNLFVEDRIYDISDPSSPTELSTLERGRGADVSEDGETLYLAQGARWSIWNISDLTNPTELTSESEDFRDVAVVNDSHIVGTDGSDEFYVFDVSDSTSPSEVDKKRIFDLGDSVYVDKEEQVAYTTSYKNSDRETTVWDTLAWNLSDLSNPLPFATLSGPQRRGFQADRQFASREDGLTACITEGEDKFYLYTVDYERVL